MAADRPAAMRVGLWVVVVVAIVLATTTGLTDDAVAAVEAAVARSGSAAALVYVAAYVIAAHLALPVSAALTVGAGFAFGFWPALALGLAANAIACTTQYAMGALLFSRRTEAFVARRPLLARVDTAVRARTAHVVALARLSPPLPFAVLNYAAGALRWRALPYALGSAVGLIPSEIAFVWVGTATRGASTAAAGSAERALTGVGVVATLALVAWIGRAARRRLDTAAPTAASAASPQATAASDGARLIRTG